MAIDFYWGSGSSPCWRVALALEFKRLKYNSHLLHFDLQEHKSPQMLAMNFRGRLPVLRDNDYVVFESLAILYYLDQKYPDPPIFGRNAEEAGVIMRVICEYQSYAEPPLKQIVALVRASARSMTGWPRRCTGWRARRAPSSSVWRTRTGWSARVFRPPT